MITKNKIEMIPRAPQPFSHTVNVTSKTSDIEHNLAKNSIQIESYKHTSFAKVTYDVPEDTYINNPTRTPLASLLIKGDNENEYVLNFNNTNHEIMYVVNEYGEIFIGTRPFDVRRPHPTLLGQPDPKALCAGLLKIQDKLIFKVDLASGHFQPIALAIESALRAFGRLPESIYHKNFLGFCSFDGKHSIKPAFTRFRATQARQLNTENSMKKLKELFENGKIKQYAYIKALIKIEEREKK